MMSLSSKSSAGFTMIELGMVLVIVSFIIGPIFSYMMVQRDRANYQVTLERQRKIATAFSIFAQKHSYLPCPSQSTNSPLGVGMTHCHTPATYTSRQGIVPFAVLGLSRKDIIDGYGNPFTYAVSLGAVDIPDNNPAVVASPLQVFPACYIPASTSTVPRYERWRTASRIKAYFCCRRARRDTAADHALIVYEKNNASGGGYREVADVQGTYSNNPQNSQLGQAPTDANIQYNLRYIAYVLISHGKNGAGANVLGRAGLNAWRAAGTQERVNGDTSSLEFYDLPISTRANNNYFDDIVLWRTQEQTISETGSNSCMNP